MKVAYLCDTYTPQINGVTNTLEQLRRYVESKGIEAVFMVPRYDRITRKEKNVHRFFSFRMPLSPECRLVIPPAFKLKKILDDFKPDLIHAITEFGVSLAGIRYAKKNGIPIISSYTSNFDQYLGYYKVAWLGSALDRYLKWFHNNCELTFCPSNQSMRHLTEHGITRVEIMKRGVDRDFFNPAYRSEQFRLKVGARNNSLVFTYVGRIVPEKNLDVLADSIPAIKKDYGDRAVFVFVGGGKSLDELRLKLGDKAYFTGYLRGRQLSEAYASSDIFVFPSTSETFGNVVLEAFASGLPAVVPDAGGVAEIVTPGYNGYIVPPRDSGAITQVLRGFLDNPGQIADLRRNALITARDRTWQCVFEKMFNQYSAILYRNTGGVPA